MEHYRQCKLKRGNTYQTSWIPEKFAKQNKYVKLKTNGEWIDGWQVVHVGARMDEASALKNSQNYKHQRKASDI